MNGISSNSLTQVEHLIRHGHIPRARRLLGEIGISAVERPNVAEFANLLRRAGLIDRGIRLLNPIVRSEMEFISPTSEEKIEYAVLLTRLGAFAEAREILNGLDQSSYPEILLYLTFTLTPEWRYQETIEPLQSYLSLSNDQFYLRLVAKVNLIAALIFSGQDRDLDRLLSEAISEAESQQSWFLLGSLYELSAQWEISRSRLDTAERALDMALAHLKKSGTVESLYVHKWRIVLNLMRDPLSDACYQEMTRLRKDSLKAKEWEILRDCDFHDLRFRRNSDLFVHLVAGSPMTAYRERLFTEFSHFKIPDSLYSWQLSGERASPSRQIYLDTGSYGNGKSFIEAGQLPHRLLRLLARDFYRPQRLASLAAEIFPGEVYHPHSTPLKLHQVVKRLRETIRSQKIPLRISVESGSISLYGIRNCTVIKDWKRDWELPSVQDLDLKRIRAVFNEDLFTTKQVAEILGCSISSATRKLRTACQEGHCNAIGSGRRTAFRLSHIKTAA